MSALRSLSVFSAGQAGAYREHAAEQAAALGADVDTKLMRFLSGWAGRGECGSVVLTGNAGTGKTAAAEAYCRALGVPLPTEDELLEVAPGRLVAKDLSGLRDRQARSSALAAALGSGGQSLVCANEGVLRDAVEDLDSAALGEVLDKALRIGAARGDALVVVNVNRQRPTSDALWARIVDYLARSELWGGCQGCPFDVGGCGMRSNAEKLRDPDVQKQAQALFRLAAGEAVPTLREVLAILSWALVGRQSCSEVKSRFRDLGRSASTASDAYFARLLGGGLSGDAAERSPLLAGLRRTGLGAVSDLEVDGWLRDASGAPDRIRRIAGDPAAQPGEVEVEPARRAGLDGSASPLDRVLTQLGAMTFYALGEMVSTDEDPARVEDGLKAMVHGSDTNPDGQSLWRRRVFFEAAAELGGHPSAVARLLNYPHFCDLIELAADAAAGKDTVLKLDELVRGLNFLVTGYASADEGLIVPDTACLFARDPGSFRPARPSLVHSRVERGRLSIVVPDRGLVVASRDIGDTPGLLVAGLREGPLGEV